MKRWCKPNKDDDIGLNMLSNKKLEFVQMCNYPVRVGFLNYDTLTSLNLENHFYVINKATTSSPYPSGKNFMYAATIYLKNNKKVKVNRPNHNGTHSSRQARIVECLYDLIRKKGRIDETNTQNPNFDDLMGERSAKIYEYYANQLKKTISDDLRRSTVKVMINLYYNPEEHDPNDQKVVFTEKEYFMKQILTCSHTVDLVRCYEPRLYKKKAMIWMVKYVSYFCVRNEEVKEDDVVIRKLLSFAKELCVATGSMLRIEGRYDYEPEFIKCSDNGTYCWKVLKNVKVPKW